METAELAACPQHTPDIGLGRIEHLAAERPVASLQVRQPESGLRGEIQPAGPCSRLDVVTPLVAVERGLEVALQERELATEEEAGVPVDKVILPNEPGVAATTHRPVTTLVDSFATIGAALMTWYAK